MFAFCAKKICAPKARNKLFKNRNIIIFITLSNFYHHHIEYMTPSEISLLQLDCVFINTSYEIILETVDLATNNFSRKMKANDIS